MRAVETVLAFVWIVSAAGCDGNERQERAELMESLGKVNSLNLAFPRHYANASESVLNGMSIDSLRRYVQMTHKDIPCRYVYQALEQNELIKRSFVFDRSIAPTVIEATFEFFALSRAQLQITMADIVEKGSVELGNLMWIFYTYTETFHEFWLTNSEADDDTVEGMQKIRTAHSHTSRLLVDYLKSDRCSDYYRTLTDVLLSIKSAYGQDDDGFWWYSVRYGLRFLNKIRLREGADRESDERLSMKMLRLNDLLADREVAVRVLDGFHVGFPWQVVVARATGPHPLADYGRAAFSSLITSVATVQNDFVETCKVILLRNVLTYLAGAHLISFYNRLAQVGVDEFLTETNAKMSEHIAGLVGFLQITYGQQVQRVLQTFDRPVLDFKYAVRQKRGVDDLISTVRAGVSQLLYAGKLLEPLTIGDDDKRKLIHDVGRFETDHIDDMLGSVERAECRTAEFVALIKDNFRGVDFKMINSYARLRFSEELSFLKLLEENN